MFERLDAIERQYEELRQRLELPETYSDPALYARVDREARELSRWRRLMLPIAAPVPIWRMLCS